MIGSRYSNFLEPFGYFEKIFSIENYFREWKTKIVQFFAKMKSFMLPGQTALRGMIHEIL